MKEYTVMLWSAVEVECEKEVKHKCNGFKIDNSGSLAIFTKIDEGDRIDHIYAAGRWLEIFESK